MQFVCNNTENKKFTCKQFSLEMYWVALAFSTIEKDVEHLLPGALCRSTTGQRRTFLSVHVRGRRSANLVKLVNNPGLHNITIHNTVGCGMRR